MSLGILYPLAEGWTRRAERRFYRECVESFNGQWNNMYVMDGESRIQYRLAPGFRDEHAYTPELERTFEYRINEAGFRGDDLPDLEPFRERGGRVVFHLGDSFTMGMNVTQGESFPARLDRLFGGGMLHVNGGVIGYNLEQCKESLAENLERLSPDLVVLNFYVNDADPAVIAKQNPDIELGACRSWFYELHVRPKLRAWFPGIDAFARTRRWLPSEVSHMENFETGTAARQIAENAYREMAALCRERGVLLLTVSHPLIPGTDFASDHYKYAELNGLVKTWAAAVGSPFVDLRQEILRSGRASEELIIQGDGHWEGGDRGGHAFVAEVLAARIRELLTPEPPAAR